MYRERERIHILQTNLNSTQDLVTIRNNTHTLAVLKLITTVLSPHLWATPYTSPFPSEHMRFMHFHALNFHICYIYIYIYIYIFFSKKAIHLEKWFSSFTQKIWVKTILAFDIVYWKTTFILYMYTNF